MLGVVSACGTSQSLSPTTTASTATPVTTTYLDTARIAKSIEMSILSERHLSSKVVCPTPVVQEAGVKFECTATIARKKAGKSKKPPPPIVNPFEVTVENNSGYVTYVGK